MSTPVHGETDHRGRLLSRLRPSGTAWMAGGAAALAIGIGGVCGIAPPWVVPLAVLALAGGVWLVLRPQDFWILTLAALGLSVELPVGGGTNLAVLTEVLLVLVVGVYAFRLLALGRLHWPRTPLLWPVTVYAGAIALTFLTTQFPGTTFKSGSRDLAYVVMGFFLAPLVLTSRGRLRALLRLGLLLNALLLIYGLFTQFRGGLATYKPIAEPFFRDHGIYAAFLSLPTAFLMAFWLERHPRRWMPLYRVLLLMAGVSLLLSFVRGAWMGMLALLMFLAWRYQRWWNFRTLLMVTVLTLIAVTLVFGLQIEDILRERLTSAGDMDSTVNLDRLDRWASAWGIIKDHPLFGVGWGGYPDAYYAYSRFPIAYQASLHMGSHNLYLEILSDAGLPGIAAFFWVVAVFFREAFRTMARARTPLLKGAATGAAGAMITFLTHGLVNNLGPSDKMGLGFFGLLGLMVVLSRLVIAPEETGEQRSQP